MIYLRFAIFYFFFFIFTNAIKYDNTAVVILTRNKDLIKIKKSIQGFEKNYNYKHNYPYILLNNEEFDSSFNELKILAKNITFKVVQKKEWYIPKNIDRRKLREAIKLQHKNVGYRHMCRFFAKFIFETSILKSFEYIIRLDTDSIFFNPIKFDIIQTMKDFNLLYAFAIASSDYMVEGLWDEIKKGFKNLGIKQKYTKFVTNNTDKYSKCIFYNNFEILNMKSLRNTSYFDIVNFIDKSEKFFYNRWGDAPIRTIILNGILNNSQIGYFKSIDYSHQMRLKERRSNDYSQCSKLAEKSFRIF